MARAAQSIKLEDENEAGSGADLDMELAPASSYKLSPSTSNFYFGGRSVLTYELQTQC